MNKVPDQQLCTKDWQQEMDLFSGLQGPFPVPLFDVTSGHVGIYFLYNLVDLAPESQIDRLKEREKGVPRSFPPWSGR
jgi:hypothetical protein